MSISTDKILKSMKEFHQRWSIDKIEDLKEEFSKFHTSFIQLFAGIDDYLTSESIRLYAQFYGIEEIWSRGGINSPQKSSTIKRHLEEMKTSLDIAKALELIFSLEFKFENSRIFYLKQLTNILKFRNLNLEMGVGGNGDVIFYPKGEQILDQNLVNPLLSTIDKNSGKHFIDALHNFQDKKYVKTLEELRRTLEEYFRYLLTNKANYRSNIATILKKCEASTTTQTRRLVGGILNDLELLFNINSKHNDGDIKEQECEYILYQTCTIIRLVGSLITPSSN